MRTEKIFIAIFLITILAGFAMSFTTKNYEDISRPFGLQPGNIFAQGISYDGNKMTITDEDAKIEIRGNIFENIRPQDEAGHPTFIELGDSGEITKADFTSNGKGGDYIFEGTEISNPGNSRIIFSSEEGIDVKVPEGAELFEFPKSFEGPGLKDYLTVIEGNGIGLPNDFYMSGKINYFNNRLFLNLNDETSVNDVAISDKIDGERISDLKEADLFFDGNEHEKTSVSLSRNNLFLKSFDLKGPAIKFNEKNPYIDIGKTDELSIQASDSSVKIEKKKDGEARGRITANGNAKITNGMKTIEIDGKKVYLAQRKTNDAKKSATSANVEIQANDKDGNSITKDYTIKTETQGKIEISKNNPENGEKPRVSYNTLESGFAVELWKKITGKFRARQDWTQSGVIGVKG